MSHQFYEVVHIIGLVLLFSALGGAAVRALMTGSGVPAATGSGANPRRLLGVLHGLGAFLILLGGFGMLARMGIMEGRGLRFPGWLWVKLAVWALLVAALMVVRRRPHVARPLLWSLPVLGGLAAYMVIYKPF